MHNFTDKQRSLFNTQCKTIVLLDWIKVKCGCEHEGRCYGNVKVSLSNRFYFCHTLRKKGLPQEFIRYLKLELLKMFLL